MNLQFNPQVEAQNNFQKSGIKIPMNEKMFNGNYKIIMKDKDKSEIPVSRSRKSDLGI